MTKALIITPTLTKLPSIPSFCDFFKIAYSVLNWRNYALFTGTFYQWYAASIDG
jgi:hypothetical protein